MITQTNYCLFNSYLHKFLDLISRTAFITIEGYLIFEYLCYLDFQYSSNKFFSRFS